MSSEFARIAMIEQLLTRSSEEVRLGIGDDCAVLNASGQARVWTIDAAVEGVHFSRAHMSLEQAAHRAFMAAASDVAAMGGRCVAALSALTLPVACSDAELKQLVTGIARAADACACPVIGGNLARAPTLTLSTSVLGECPRRVLTRAGAREGDAIYVTGTLGGAALGLRALLAGRTDDPRFASMIAMFRAPRARLDVALTLAELASAAIDLSDGLVQDLTHLCRASGVGAELEATLLPQLPDFAAAAAALGCSPHALALSGGEDYELLFTAPASVPRELGVRIGTITGARGRVMVRDASGQPLDVASGFDHFAES
jgi:thiamine-monophosphate kinase